ncbi:hypothetical protein I4U23_003490 [Adineta vaga]|nr:hypothetical protein I4U23_003490 [Adineta vaga]
MSKKRQRKPVPFARGFKVPAQSDIHKALGAFDNTTLSGVFDERFYETFDGLSSPKKPWDWLAQYTERGQTYAEHLQLSRTLHTPASSHRNSIYLTILGEVNSTIFDIDSLVDYTQRYFQIPVKLIHPFTNFQFDDKTHEWSCQNTGDKIRTINLYTRYDDKSKHSQIHVSSILNALTKVVPNDARCLVALTMCDLYSDDTDLFIAGLARGNNRVAVFSLYRYDPYLSFNESDWFSCKIKIGSKSKSAVEKRRNLLLLRACRLLTHEICHLFGIAHCIYYSCLMNGSGHLDEDFSQPLFECPIDLRKLHTLIEFNIHERYEQLLEFFKTHNFDNEMRILQIKLNVINHSIDSDTSSTKRKRGRHINTDEIDESHSSIKHTKC